MASTFRPPYLDHNWDLLPQLIALRVRKINVYCDCIHRLAMGLVKAIHEIAQAISPAAPVVHENQQRALPNGI